jgi:tetratricopeptide (TPR) repeat protein
LLNHALSHQQTGRLDKAETIYREILRHAPGDSNALHLLGMLLFARGQRTEAMELVRRAVELNSAVADFHNSLGTLLGADGRPAEALKAFDNAIELRPDYAEAHRNRGIALDSVGRVSDAVVSYRTATELRPQYAEAQASLAASLRRLGRLDEALNFERALLDARSPDGQAYLSAGLGFRERNRLEEALPLLRRAVELMPQDAGAHFNLSLALLTIGQFEEGWNEYEWRWRLKDFTPSRHAASSPLWSGEHLPGRTILLHTEQGLGSNIQFIRYVPLVAARVGSVVIECPESLRRLFATVDGVAQVATREDNASPFDVQAPLLSLPRIFGTRADNIPATVPYVHPDPLLFDRWGERLRRADGRLRVGVVWAGNPKPDPRRTCPLNELGALVRVKGLDFYSFQKGSATRELAQAPESLILWDMAADFKDFADTAAALAHMDLVISVDTSVAHLAGAMGKPTWTLLPYAADWRWLMPPRVDSPWYPTMRLFRQSDAGDWGGVLDRVAAELSRVVSQSQMTAGVDEKKAAGSAPLIAAENGKLCSVLIGCYGDYPEYSVRCLESILADVQAANFFDVHVACCACGDRTLERLWALYGDRRIQTLLVTQENINKDPMLRLLIERTRTPYFVWLDDDTHISAGLLGQVHRFIRDRHPFDGAGDFFSIARSPQYVTLARQRPWWREPPQEAAERGRMLRFPTGGFWVGRTEFCREHDFPDGGMIKQFDDVLFGELLAMHGHGLQLPAHILANVRMSDAPRRGAAK